MRPDLTLAAPVIGMAQGGLETFDERLNHGRRAQERQPDGRSSQLPLRLGEAAAEVWEARCILRQDCQEILARA